MIQELICDSIFINCCPQEEIEKWSVCVCVYTGRWNDCKVTHVMGMNIGVSIFFKK